MIASAITAGASRVATGQLCLLAVAITPAGLMELVRSYCPINGGPPTLHGGRAPALIVSRPAQRSLHVTACMLAKSPKRPSTPEAPTASFPPPPLRLLPGGANPVPGRDFHPQSTSAFSRRTRDGDLTTVAPAAHDGDVNVTQVDAELELFPQRTKPIVFLRIEKLSPLRIGDYSPKNG